MLDQSQIDQAKTSSSNDSYPLEQRITDVVQSWPKLTCRYIGLPPEGPYDLPLEATIPFRGPYEGCLTIRTINEMPQGIISEKDKKSKFIDEVEIFQEFVAVFANRLMSDLFGKNQALIKRENPSFTNFLCWPKEEPAAQCSYIVDGCPFEVRLWMKQV